MSELGRFLTNNEKGYRKKRTEVISKISSQIIADNPFLFANRIEIHS